MEKNMKKFLFADAVILIFLFLISSTNLFIKEKKTEIYRLAVLTDTPQSRQLENFRAGAIKAAEQWNADISFIPLSADDSRQQKQDILKKELDNGCRGVVVQCGNSSHLSAMLEKVPVGVPVVLYDSEADSARVRTIIKSDAEEESRLLTEAILEGRTKGEGVTIIENGRNNQPAGRLHDLTEEKLMQAGVSVSRITLEEDCANTFVSGMALQGRNILVSCDMPILQALGNANSSGMPIYGAGLCGGIQELLESGKISGTIGHRDYEAGYQAIEQLAFILCGKGTYTEEITVQSALITKETMFENVTESIIFPYV